MFLWKRIAPRLILLVLFTTFLLLAVDPLVHWAVIRSGNAVTGASFSVESIRTEWNEDTIQLRGIRAVDPQNPTRAIFTAELMNLELVPAELIHRRAHIQRAQVTGVRVESNRRIPPILERNVDGSYSAQLAERFVDDGGQWLETAGEELERRMNGVSSTVEAVQEVLNRWPGQYESLERKTETITDRIADLDGLLAGAGKNPLRNAGSYQQAISELESLGRELDEVRRSADQLHQQLLIDRESIVEAQAINLESIHDDLAVDALHKEHLTEYLLGPEVAHRVTSLAKWVRWGRDFFPAIHSPSPGLTGRGTDVQLPGIAAKPAILLDTIVVNGEAIVGDSNLHLEGRIAGLSSAPASSTTPTEVVIQTTGAIQLLIQASFQGTGPKARDTIIVNCPNFELPERILGDSGQLALKVSPARAHYWAQINVHGESLSGEMLIKQEGASLQPIMGQSLQATPVAGLVSEASGRIAAINTSIQLSGSLDNPRWSLRSNLGHELADNLQDSLRRQLVARNEIRLKSVQQDSLGRIAKIEASLTAQYAALLESIEAANGAIRHVVDHVATRVGETDGLIDQGSPLRETIRR